MNHFEQSLNLTDKEQLVFNKCLIQIGLQSGIKTNPSITYETK